MLSDAELIERHSIPEPNSGCWLWVGSVNSWGYGRLGENRRERQAHRLSFTVRHGAIPRGVSVLHRCDVPACVNPDHLFLGTLSDNVQDCIKKGRHRTTRGSANPQAKLSEAAVADLRRRTVKRGSISRWALEFGVSRRAIGFALRGDTWQA